MMTPYPPPAGLAEELRKVTMLELSVPAKIRYVLLLIAASIMTALVVALLLTEPALPLRTSVALAVMAVIGVSWAGFAIWVLRCKRILLGQERVAASRFALAFTAVFTAGSGLIGYVTGQSAALAAAGLGVVMCGVAVVLWMRARSVVAALSARRQTLERELRGAG